MLADKRRQTPALLVAHGGQRCKRPRQRLVHAGETHRPLLLARLRLLDDFHDAAHAEQAVEPRRFGLPLSRVLGRKRHQLVQQLAVDARPRRLAAARQRERERDIAALEALDHRGAGRRLQDLEAGGKRQRTSRLRPLSALQLPGPADWCRSASARSRAQIGHAGDGQGRPPTRVEHEI
jgi:hypothetical protein